MREIIHLFGFDSITAKNELNDIEISYIQEWAAPELVVSGGRQDVCEATDFLSIGEVLFTRVMGRHTSMQDRRSNSVYNFQGLSLLENPDEPLCRKLTVFSIIHYAAA